MAINDPVLYYTMDTADISGTTITDRGSGGNDGAILGAPSSVAGHLAEALVFDGAGKAIQVSPSETDNMPDFAIAMWAAITMPDTGEIADLLDKEAVIRFKIDTAGFNQLGLSLAISYSGTNLSYVTTDIKSIVMSGTWAHFVASFTGATNSAKLYVNGAEIGYNGATPGSGTRASDAGRLIVGNGVFINRSAFGAIDEVKVFNHTLSDADVSAIYSGSSGAVVGTRTWANGEMIRGQGTRTFVNGGRVR